MRVAVHNPDFLLRDPARNFDGYNLQFLRLFRPLVYATTPRRAARYFQLMRRHGLRPRPADFVWTAWGLRRRADVLVCFEGRADLPAYAPPPWFTGMKAYHGMDFVFRATECAAALARGGVDYMMGYADHGRHSDFFARFYPRYVDRLIPVPFGFGARFADATPFERRERVVLGVGSVNPVADPTAPDPDDLRDYVSHHRGVEWTHRWRRMLVEHKAGLAGVLESRFPEFPQTKDAKYDAVGLLNQFAMFANDEGLMGFPPARTYEGTACGAAIVCSDHPCYDDVGLEDGVTAVRHRRHDLGDFRDKVRHYQRNPDLLAAVARRGRDFVRGRYAHELVATRLYMDLEQRWHR